MKASRLPAPVLDCALADAGALVLVASDRGDASDVVSDAFGTDVLGFVPASAVGLRLAHVLPLRDLADLERLLIEAREQPDTPLRARDVGLVEHEGKARWVDLAVRTTRPSRGGRTVMVTIVDVTERREVTQRAADQAARDPLTDLANGRRFGEHLEAAVHRSRRTGEHLAVLYVDLERFRNVNEAFGTAGGDAVLRTTAARLKEALRAEDVVARVRGDQFAVLLAGLETHVGRGYAVDVVDRLSRSLAEPITLAGRDVRLDVSIGVAHRSGGRSDPTAGELLGEAQSNMDEVKKNARRWKQLRASGA